MPRRPVDPIGVNPDCSCVKRRASPRPGGVAGRLSDPGQSIRVAGTRFLAGLNFGFNLEAEMTSFLSFAVIELPARALATSDTGPRDRLQFEEVSAAGSGPAHGDFDRKSQPLCAP
jgi:hypothetical protein